MKKNIAIVVLSIALLLCLFQAGAGIWRISKIRAVERALLTSGFDVWRKACDHAAAGDRTRARWCEWAAEATAPSISLSASEEDLETLAVEIVTRQMKAEHGK